MLLSKMCMHIEKMVSITCEHWGISNVNLNLCVQGKGKSALPLPSSAQA